MPSSEAVLLILGVLLLMVGLAGGAVKAFNVELPAVTGRYARLTLLGLGAIFTLLGVWLILRSAPSSATSPTAVATPASLPASESPATTAAPASASQAQATTGVLSSPIGLNETVTGTLYYNEGNQWVFSQGPATVDIVLDVGPYGEALIILYDPDGVQREYVDAQNGREERLVNYTIPEKGGYTILVRNTNNTQVHYRLTIQASQPPGAIRPSHLSKATLVM